MAQMQNSSYLSTWSSSSDANLCSKLENFAASRDLDGIAWHQLERATSLQPSTRFQFLCPDVLGSVNELGNSGQLHGLKLQAALNETAEGTLDRIPALDPQEPSSSFLPSFPSLARSIAEEIKVPELVYREEEAPPRKIKTGRRRRTSDDSPDGWVASKNLISERRRREKLQKGLITLRELVPMYTMKMDKVSILIDSINYLQELQQTVEMLESGNDDKELDTEPRAGGAKSSSSDLERSTDAENEAQPLCRKSSSDGSFSSEFSDELGRSDHDTNSSCQDWELQYQVELEVTKLDHGVYKLDVICKQQPGVLVQLSQAIEAFVIEIVHTSIVVITSTKVSCNFIVKMSSWNEMTVQEVKADIRKLTRIYGLHFSEV